MSRTSKFDLAGSPSSSRASFEEIAKKFKARLNIRSFSPVQDQENPYQSPSSLSTVVLPPPSSVKKLPNKLRQESNRSSALAGFSRNDISVVPHRVDSRTQKKVKFTWHRGNSESEISLPNLKVPLHSQSLAGI
jgi:hypothetical protein